MEEDQRYLKNSSTYSQRTLQINKILQSPLLFEASRHLLHNKPVFAGRTNMQSLTPLSYRACRRTEQRPWIRADDRRRLKEWTEVESDLLRVQPRGFGQVQPSQVAWKEALQLFLFSWHTVQVIASRTYRRIPALWIHVWNSSSGMCNCSVLHHCNWLIAKTFEAINTFAKHKVKNLISW